MRRLVQALLVMLLLADLAASLRHDLALYSWRRGSELLRRGDHAGALVLLRRAGRLAPGSLPIAYDTGVALYRLGEWQKARESFAAASRTSVPGLRTAALYNLGNCVFRQGERAAGVEKTKAGNGERPGEGREAAGRLFQEAARRYEQVLACAPGAADARHNLTVVHSRQAEPLRGAGAAAPGAHPGKEAGREQAGGDPTGKGPGQRGMEGEGARRAGEASPDRRGASGRETAGTPPGDPFAAAAGKARPSLTRAASERLLNEARGREKMSPAHSAQGERGRQARPEKDW